MVGQRWFAWCSANTVMFVASWSYTVHLGNYYGCDYNTNFCLITLLYRLISLHHPDITLALDMSLTAVYQGYIYEGGGIRIQKCNVHHNPNSLIPRYAKIYVLISGWKAYQLHASIYNVIHVHIKYTYIIM